VDKPQVFDYEGRERDWDWLVSTFGAVRMEHVKLPEGVNKVFRLVKLQDTQGAGVQVVHVVDEEGNPLEGVRVARYWPDAPELPAWPRPTSMWRRRGVYGETNVNGDIGFGMGAGDYYYEPRLGASAVWVADERGPSDLITGLGMVGGTPHRHLDVHFQLQEIESEPVEEPVVAEPAPFPPAEPPAEEPVVAEPAPFPWSQNRPPSHPLSRLRRNPWSQNRPPSHPLSRLRRNPWWNRFPKRLDRPMPAPPRNVGRWSLTSWI